MESWIASTVVSIQQPLGVTGQLHLIIKWAVLFVFVAGAFTGAFATYLGFNVAEKLSSTNEAGTKEQGTVLLHKIAKNPVDAPSRHSDIKLASQERKKVGVANRRAVQTQSMVTYRRDLASPKFQLISPTVAVVDVEVC